MGGILSVLQMSSVLTSCFHPLECQRNLKEDCVCFNDTWKTDSTISIAEQGPGREYKQNKFEEGGGVICIFSY